MKATATAEKSTAVVKKFVTLGLGKERYGVEVSKAKEIIASYEIVPLPKTPDFIEGMISLRGEIIPVVDLRKRFSLTPKERDAETRVIVVELHDFVVGIQVDKVYEVMKLAEDEIEPPPALVSGLKADYLEGVAEVNSLLITILNLDEIFSTSEKLLLIGTEEAETPEAKTIVEDKTPQPEQVEPVTATELHAVVSSDGMVEYCGKSYFVGKRQKGKDVVLEEAGGILKVLEGGEVLKEFIV